MTGKTFVASKLCISEKFTFERPFDNVILVNGGKTEQDSYTKLMSHYTEQRMAILDSFTPENLTSSEFYGEKRPNLTILDDLMDQLGRHDVLLELVTKTVSRLNLHLIFITQLISNRKLHNIKPALRNCTCTVIPLHLRNRAIFLEILGDIFGSNKLFGVIFDDARREGLSFILINLGFHCSEKLRICSYNKRGLPSVAYPIFGE